MCGFIFFFKGEVGLIGLKNLASAVSVCVGGSDELSVLSGGNLTGKVFKLLHEMCNEACIAVILFF